MRKIKITLTTAQLKVIRAAIEDHKACNMGPSARDVEQMDISQDTLEYYDWLHSTIEEIRKVLMAAARRKKIRSPSK